MTDNTKMVDLPWADGTIRTVPEFTPYVERIGVVAFARDGGYSYRASADSPIRSHDDDSQAVRILTEAPEPPVKVIVPTGLAAVVSIPGLPNEPGYVLTGDGWYGLRTCLKYDPSEMADELRAGARVLFRGLAK